MDIKVGNIITLQTDWEIGNGGPDTSLVPEGMQFEVMAITDHLIEIQCLEDDYPYDNFSLIILHDDLEDFRLDGPPEKDKP